MGLSDPVLISSGSKLIDVEHGHAHPLFHDMDLDGKKDLVVGQFEGGIARTYRNTGSKGAPNFPDYSTLKAGGIDAKVTFGCCIGFGPQIADFNSDGIQDVLSGSFNGQIYIFHGRKDNEFDPPVFVKNEFDREVILDNSTSISLYDWNKDGKTDIIVGTINGPVWYLQNIGQDKVAPEAQLLANNEPIDAPDGGPCATDWDGDGVMDLFIGQDSGRVRFFKGKTGGDSPQFSESVDFLAPLTAVQLEPWPMKPGFGNDWSIKRPLMRPKITVCDWNEDGKKDVLIGDFSLLEGRLKDLPADQMKEFVALRTEQSQIKEKSANIVSGIVKATFAEIGAKVGQKLTDEQNLKYAEVYDRKYRENSELQALDKRAAEIFEKLTPLSPEIDYHGFVWLFLHK